MLKMCEHESNSFRISKQKENSYSISLHYYFAKHRYLLEKIKKLRQLSAHAISLPCELINGDKQFSGEVELKRAGIEQDTVYVKEILLSLKRTPHPHNLIIYTWERERKDAFFEKCAKELCAPFIHNTRAII